MKPGTKDIFKHLIAVMLSAFAAALISFIQATMTQQVGCPIEQIPIGEAGVLGAGIKASHSIFSIIKGTMHV